MVYYAECSKDNTEQVFRQELCLRWVPCRLLSAECRLSLQNTHRVFSESEEWDKYFAHNVSVYLIIVLFLLFQIDPFSIIALGVNYCLNRKKIDISPLWFIGNSNFSQLFPVEKCNNTGPFCDRFAGMISVQLSEIICAKTMEYKA